VKPDPGPLVPELLQSPEGTQLAPDPPLKSEPELPEGTQPAQFISSTSMLPPRPDAVQSMPAAVRCRMCLSEAPRLGKQMCDECHSTVVESRADSCHSGPPLKSPEGTGCTSTVVEKPEVKPDPGPLVPELLQSPEGTQLAPDPPLKSEPESEDTQPAPDPPTEALEVQVKAEATTEDAACTGTATAGEGSHSTTTTTIYY
jgi:hypothetical protein